MELEVILSVKAPGGTGNRMVLVLRTKSIGIVHLDIFF